MALKRVKETTFKNKQYDFQYSNFGMAILGIILEEIYNDSYSNIVQKYIVEDLCLKNTNFSIGTDNFENYWEWKQDDVYISSGGLTSTIDDMLKYAQIQLSTNSSKEILDTHKSLINITSNSTVNEKMNIHMDEIGMGWDE